MSAFSLVGEVWLRPGKDDALRRRHPWVYRGALARPLPQSLGPVAVFSASGDYLGVGLPSSSSGSLALRMVCFAPEPWEPSTLHQRLQGAWRLRKRLRIVSEAWRLLHAEGDGVPGLVADVYGRYLVFELYEPLWELYLQLLAEVAMSLTGARHVLLRRTYREGVEVVKGDLPREPVSVREHRWRLLADLAAGQKTGLFLDQRDNRWLVCRNSRGTRLLNLFAYTGGFAVAALLGGAETVLNVESSGRALALAQQTYVANGLPVREGEFLQGDAFTVCRRLAAKGEQFDWVVVDPPAFVKGPGQETRGLSGYRDVNLQALKLLRRGGMLLTCSCSARITVEQLEGALLAAALDAGREVRVLERRGAGPDHPVSLFCPETRHLKALWCAVL
ncbi:MAG: class I SAM-dependent rRNA methyltransferase [Thermoanaerobaculum sp.]|nr:class I SAM-dependent rRNA methyltransferase [Thermoanaerobaculum sp.]MDW7966747.1 class I SAM-dependent rRNA methyltransferase [Thermoanaerobaculum sp.]